jgi:hypothetical protein
VFAVDRKLGRLKSTGQYLPVGNPSCVTFVDLAKGGLKAWPSTPESPPRNTTPE